MIRHQVLIRLTPKTTMGDGLLFAYIGAIVAVVSLAYIRGMDPLTTFLVGVAVGIAVMLVGWLAKVAKARWNRRAWGRLRALADKLTELDSEAINGVLNGEFTNEAALILADSQWQDKVKQILREARVAAQTIKHFCELGDVPFVHYLDKPEWAQKTLRGLSLRRQRLNEIIDRCQMRRP